MSGLPTVFQIKLMSSFIYVKTVYYTRVQHSPKNHAVKKSVFGMKAVWYDWANNVHGKTPVASVVTWPRGTRQQKTAQGSKSFSCSGVWERETLNFWLSDLLRKKSREYGVRRGDRGVWLWAVVTLQIWDRRTVFFSDDKVCKDNFDFLDAARHRFKRF